MISFPHTVIFTTPYIVPYLLIFSPRSVTVRRHILSTFSRYQPLRGLLPSTFRCFFCPEPVPLNDCPTFTLIDFLYMSEFSFPGCWYKRLSPPSLKAHFFIRWRRTLFRLRLITLCPRISSSLDHLRCPVSFALSSRPDVAGKRHGPRARLQDY